VTRRFSVGGQQRITAQGKTGSLNTPNVASRQVDLDNSQPLGGFHWNNARKIYVELRYRFHLLTSDEAWDGKSMPNQTSIPSEARHRRAPS
jgi:hypothetical protein